MYLAAAPSPAAMLLAAATQIGRAYPVRVQGADEAITLYFAPKRPTQKFPTFSAKTKVPSAQVGEYNIYNIYDTCGDGNMSTAEELFGGASEAIPFNIRRSRHRLWGPRNILRARSLHHPHAEIIW